MLARLSAAISFAIQETERPCSAAIIGCEHSHRMSPTALIGSAIKSWLSRSRSSGCDIHAKAFLTAGKFCVPCRTMRELITVT